MSLGPPFDQSGERLRLGLGAATAVTLLVAIGVALLAADRSLGESVTVHMLVQRPGALHTGAMVRVAGEQIGEVVAIRGYRPSPGLKDGPGADPGAEPTVDIELRLRKRWAEKVYENSTFLPVNPTVLAEALIEIGPPAGGAAPGSPIGAEQRVRGVEPADLDQLLRRVYQSIELTLQQARELGAEWTELNEAFTALSARLSVSLPDTLRVQVQGAAARQGIEQLLAAGRAAEPRRVSIAGQDAALRDDAPREAPLFDTGLLADGVHALPRVRGAGPCGREPRHRWSPGLPVRSGDGRELPSWGVAPPHPGAGRSCGLCDAGVGGRQSAGLCGVAPSGAAARHRAVRASARRHRAS